MNPHINKKIEHSGTNLYPYLTIILIFLLIISCFFNSGCTNNHSGRLTLDEFIASAQKDGLPTQYIKVIKDDIKIKFGRFSLYNGALYSEGKIVLDITFKDERGQLKEYNQMDIIQIATIYHECFHAYVDLKIRKNIASYEESTEFEKIMENARIIYKNTALGKNILWDNYKLKASEESMAVYITNLIKYKIILEKDLDTASNDYLEGYVTKQQLESKIEGWQNVWMKVLDGKMTLGYFNRSVYVLYVANELSPLENNFIRKFILPGIEDSLIFKI